MALATLIVPPLYMAIVLGDGSYGVKISARKVATVDKMGRTLKSCIYRQADKVHTMDFAQLVQFVNARAGA